MLYIFFGQDTFSLRQEVDRLRRSLGSDDAAASVTVLDSAKTSAEEVLTAWQTLPFFGERRLVIVEGLLARFNPAGRTTAARRRSDQTAIPERWQPLVQQADLMPDANLLLLLDEAVADGNPLFQALRPRAQAVRKFQPPELKAMPAWIDRRAADMGLRLSPGAARLLANLVGNDLWALAAEMEKLTTYAAGRVVEERDVRELVALARQASVYTLVDAALAGQAAVALRLLRQLTAAGVDPSYVLFLLTGQYRLVLLAKEQTLAGLAPPVVGDRLGINRNRAWLLPKVLEQARGYSLPALEAAYRRLLEADVSIKRGIHSPDLALDLLVCDLAAMASHRNGDAK